LCSSAAPHIPEVTEFARFTETISKGEKAMLWTIAVILFVLWALGLVTSYTIGGYIHILLVLAVIVVLVRVIQGRRVL
jgi:Na+/H+ antiporter NhaC